VLAIISAGMSLVALFFLLYDSTFNPYVVPRFLAWDLSLAVSFAIMAVLAKRHYALASGLFLFTFFVLATAFPIQIGRFAGVHYFLLAIGPVMPVLYGTRRLWVIAAVSVACLVTFLAVEFTVPMYVVPERPLLPQLRIPFKESLDLDYNDSIFMLVMAALQAVLSLATFASFRATENAEAALEREYARSEMLLQSLLPRPIAARLKDQPDQVIADEFDLVTVLFADVVGFTPRAASRRPDATVRFLERVFSEFDALAEKHGLEKIKTIGDSYMVAGGLTLAGGNHTFAVADMALDMIKTAERLTEEFGEEVSIRIGFHAGPAIAGVIGRKKPFYDVWGDTINVAARMESSSLPGRIQITSEVKNLLGTRYDF
jgi:adenylate cyclase